MSWNDTLQCGVEARWLDGYRPTPPRAEARVHRGEPIVLYWYAQEGGEEVVRDVARFELEGDRVSRVRNYFFSPEVVAEISRELGLPSRPNGYRYWRATT